MQVIPLRWDDVGPQIDTLGEQTASGPVTVTYGIASFPTDVRHPEAGFSVHAGTEISFILDGVFDIETPDGTVRVTRDNLLVVPAGEPHSTTVIAAGRIAYFLLADVQKEAEHVR